MTQTDLESLLKQAFAYSDAGRYPEAARALAEILRVSPNHPEALHELGMMHHRCGRGPEAMECLSRAANAAPGNGRYRFNLALMMMQNAPPGRAKDAGPHFLKAADLAAERRDAAMLDTIGSALYQAGLLTAACATYRRSLAFRANEPAVHNRLAIALQEMGKLDEALAATNEALKLKPGFADAISNALLTLNYHDRFTPEEVAAEHKRLAGQLAPQGTSLPAKRQAEPNLVRKAAADGRIRVGYLSPDLCQHSVAFFIYPILQNHDREKFSITCYADVAKPDLVTQDLERRTERWRPIHGMSDDQVAQQIAADEIDILVDLAGHTKANRMALFARRVAPIQATYLGYPNTSGLTTIDYRITDALADPVGQTEPLHSEKLIRLPDAFFTYLTPSGYPDVTPPPAAQNSAGGVTFAVMTNFAKVRPASMELWARVIESVPGSRLLIQAKALDDPETRQSVEQFFAARGIKDDRLDLRGWAHFPEFLQQLASVDIALDTFPFVGHTASCNLLWMGIPIVTRAGIAHRSRMGVSILTNLGLSDFVAQSDDVYVRIAGELAADLPRLTELRLGMRQRMSESVLMDGPRFVRNLESAYEQMIREVFP